MEQNKNLKALVDMGSNGIRFSISDLSPKTARIMPTIYQDRSGISLYDAQYSSGTKAAIPDDIIAEVLSALLRFRQTCEEFGVPTENIQVLATEATREAVNSVEYRKSIKEVTGWEVEMLPKEEEGQVGAMGVASSFNDVNGLLMDLGGGSTQMTWMSTENGKVSIGDGGSVSLPYGAAALLRRLQEADKSGSRRELRLEVESRLKAAFESLGAPSKYTKSTLDPNDKGFELYLSGGGFRGWGYVLMSEHAVKPYPIPIINGFSVEPATFLDSEMVKDSVKTQREASTAGIFRVSERRGDQIPAVAFLVTALATALPRLSRVRFCQGGVREGTLFSSLPPEIRGQRPLTTATAQYAADPASADILTDLLYRALPPSQLHPFAQDLIAALANTMYLHRSLPKELRAVAALRSTTAGFLASVHGVSHEDRTALALILCARWGGEVSPVDAPFLAQLETLAGAELTWWCRYMGRCAAAVGDFWPAGTIRDPQGDDVENNASRGGKKMNKGTGVSQRPRLSWECSSVEDTQARRRLVLVAKLGEGVNKEAYAKSFREIEKCGKKKNYPTGGEQHGEAWGLKVDLTVS